MIKSELRKLFTVRSTYVVTAMVVILVAFVAWVTVRGFKQELRDIDHMTSQVDAPAPRDVPAEEVATAKQEMAQAINDFEERKVTRQRQLIMDSIGIATIFASIIAILQIVHEYRWNTIMHTLTASRSRTKVFFSKTGVLLGFSLVLGLIAAVVCMASYKITISVYDVAMPTQSLDWGAILPRASAYILTFVALVMVIAYVSRNIALAIAGFLIFPSTIEPLLGLLLKSKAIYLPFSASSHIVLFNKQNPPESLDFKHALIVMLIYLAVLYPITWLLFLKRDAN